MTGTHIIPARDETQTCLVLRTIHVCRSGQGSSSWVWLGLMLVGVADLHVGQSGGWVWGWNGCVTPNLRQCNRSKKNYRKIIVIGQIIGSGKIDSFMCIKSVIGSISIFLDRKVTKMINNRKVIGLNRIGRLKHQIEIFFGRSSENFTEKNL